jgi:hypothetical protein
MICPLSRAIVTPVTFLDRYRKRAYCIGKESNYRGVIMDAQSHAFLASQRPVTELATSALPDAPVVATVTRPERPPTTTHARSAVAGALHHLANAVAP